ncbi:complement factor H-related protein 1-like isoform X2 [Trachinotus anak]|uniref:complement factor H-related protein 1-like isoform X2 n=1 Tax=Trachinotus anak TaxID=443729 RepID=UPI0039F1B337
MLCIHSDASYCNHKYTIVFDVLGARQACSTLPEVPHAHVSEETKKSEYQEGDVIHFTCESGYTSGPVIKYVCSSEGWLAVRQGTCNFSGSSCDRPPAGEGVTVYGLPENDNPILPHHVLTFSCDGPGNFLIGHAVLTCGQDGQWDNPFPSCTALLWCGAPPPLADGDIIGIPRSKYRLNDRVKYSCQAYYIMQGVPFKTCQNGEWTGEMRCLKPCTVSREIMNSRNIAFRYNHEDKLYSTHGDALHFVCTRGRPVGTVEMRQTCNDGVMELPSCQ